MAHELVSTALVIIGVTGDLSRRKLLPAVERIVAAGAVPEQLQVIGVSRRAVATAEVLKGVSLTGAFLQENLQIYQMDITDLDDYVKLSKHLDSLEVASGVPMQRLFYLSVPPQISRPIVRLIGESGLAKHARTKLLLEKPFGTDLSSAEDLIDQVKLHFTEEQIYRIDHYLAKEMTQNLVVFRQHNSLFKRTWNHEFIESIEIVASEEIGIEGRSEFYEQTGALRDIIQSHLLQLAALALADIQSDDWQKIPASRLSALRQLHSPQIISEQAVRGQYKGYRDEVANPTSDVETFVSLTLYSNDARWKDVPITLTTGKALQTKTTEIRLQYKQDATNEANRLILRIQPNEGVEIDLVTKQPGYERNLQTLSLGFAYSNHFAELPEAYERVFVDAIRSDRALFTTSEEVLETWRILEPVQSAWSMHNQDLVFYNQGSTPSEIGTMLRKGGK